MREKRKTGRYKVALQVHYPHRRGHRLDWTETISEGGLFLRTSEKHRVGEPVTLAISFPGVLEPIEVAGEVAWVRPPAEGRTGGVGLRVDSEACSRRLAELLPLAGDPSSLLFEGPYARLAAIGRLRLALLPTPLHRADRLTEVLGGPEIWFKRDDLTSFALGGNKVRKLEFLAAEAVDRGADTLVTGGKSGQSNHVRLTMAAAAHLGLEGVAVVREGHGAGGEHRGNLLLNDLLGARIHRFPAEDLDVDQAIETTVRELEAEGKKPYGIRLGGASWLGSVGYVLASLELAAQLSHLKVRADALICATGSCGTQAGLVAGERWLRPGYRVRGMSISRPAAACRSLIAKLAAEVDDRVGLDLGITEEDVSVNDDYVGDGYAIPTEAAREAIRLVARTEGVFLDPIYTGKAMAGLIDLISRGEFHRGQTVVFLHTGGWPALFA